jgi:hypothetical protein
LNLTNVKIKVKQASFDTKKRKQGDRNNQRFRNRPVYKPDTGNSRADSNNRSGDDRDKHEHKRPRDNKPSNCLWHPDSQRESHTTSTCNNPYSRASLWAEQGNRYLINKE